MMDLAFLWETLTSFLSGVPLTLKLASSSVAIGAAVALLLVSMRMSPIAGLAWLARAYVFIFRGTPLLVQIFLVYYGLGQFRPALQGFGLWAFFREPYWCALVALTLNTAAYTSEIIRGGLLAVPQGQVEAARAHGMSRFLLLRRYRPPDRASAGDAGLRQRNHSDDQGDLARLHHHPDGGHRHRAQADFRELSRGRDLPLCGGGSISS